MPASTIFNEACYLARYPDVVAFWKGKAIDHYMTGGGQQQGRVPGCDLPGTVYSTEFNEEAYRARYPDINAFWKGSGYDHYMTGGGKEQGRVPGYEIVKGELPAGSVVTPGTVMFLPVDEKPKDPTADKPKETTTPAVTASKLTDEHVNSKSGYLVIALGALLLIGIIVVIVKRKKIFG